MVITTVIVAPQVIAQPFSCFDSLRHGLLQRFCTRLISFLFFALGAHVACIARTVVPAFASFVLIHVGQTVWSRWRPQYFASSSLVQKPSKISLIENCDVKKTRKTHFLVQRSSPIYAKVFLPCVSLYALKCLRLYWKCTPINFVGYTFIWDFYSSILSRWIIIKWFLWGWTHWLRTYWPKECIG